MRLLIALFSLLISTNSAVALSCIPSSIERAFNGAHDSTDRFIMVYGEFLNKRNVIAPPAINNIPQDTTSTITFSGMQSKRKGFISPITIDVNLTESCAAHWCGGVSMANNPVLTFIQVSPNGYALDIGPCGGSTFYQPQKDIVQRALNCLRGKACIPKNDF